MITPEPWSSIFGEGARSSRTAGNRLRSRARRIYREDSMSPTGARQDLQTIQQSVAAGSVVVASTGTGPFEQILLDGRHALHADEPVVVPENSIRWDSRGEAESAHHPMRCLRSSTYLHRS